MGAKGESKQSEAVRLRSAEEMEEERPALPSGAEEVTKQMLRAWQKSLLEVRRCAIMCPDLC